MEGAFRVVLVAALCTVNVIQAKLGPPGGPMKLKKFDLPESFKIISSWESALSIADSDSDDIFDCLTANRTAIDYEAQTATFVWTLRQTDHSPRQEITFSVRPGPTPGTMEMTVGDDPTVLEGIFYYMDDDCLVMDLEYHGHQCLLWVRKEVKDRVPQECFVRFADACGEPIRQHRRQLCPDV
uniref:Putative lipocalin-5 1 n=1 Tax=Rhipicephalus microplus TaxID=6941 RepID=A0A6M2D1F1_RHIMP